MTKADEYENKPLAWWLQQLSARQLWGLFSTVVIVVAGAGSAGLWIGSMGRSIDDSAVDPSLAQVDTVYESPLPDGLSSFDVELLRVLAEPHTCMVSLDYLGYRLRASQIHVETVLEKLHASRLLAMIVKDGSGDAIGAVISPEGREFMEVNGLFPA